MKDSEHISSLSYGYTAGASYRTSFTSHYTRSYLLTTVNSGGDGKGVLGSLTLGGYDKSRFVANDVSFDINSSTTADFVVQLASITAHPDAAVSNDSVPITNGPIYTFVNSAVPDMWLPDTVCAGFASVLGLIYDSAQNTYVINSSSVPGDDQIEYDLTFSFLSNDSRAVDIIIPYASFDLSSKPDPHNELNRTRYFPLRNATDNVYTLGRAFLQETYIIVDHERGNFSLHQAHFDVQKDIVAIEPITGQNPPTNNTNTGSSSTSLVSHRSTWIGSVAGALVIFTFIVIMMYV